MNKRIVIKIGDGSLTTGYAATVQIGEEGLPPQVEVPARLPPAPDIPKLYRRWQSAYWQLGLQPSLSWRLEALGGVTNVSDVSAIEQCRVMSVQLRDHLHYWLNGEDFRPIREKILEQLSPQDTARVLLQTQDVLLQRLPWYDLHIFQRYRKAEVGICLPRYQRVSYRGTRSKKVRVLAVLGDATGLDTQMDCQLLGQLPDADVHFLNGPSVEAFNEKLWDQQGWDILFFAGHSKSRVNCVHDVLSLGVSSESSDSVVGNDNDSVNDIVNGQASGEIQLNATETLTVPQLKHALSKAIDRGLNTAIFNSCDGLGLAADLADLYIPQVLVMREPVPDKVAHAFLQGFLASFSAGNPFYLAVREAREKLQGMEARFPCATWLPVIVQNLAEMPPTWRSLQDNGDGNLARESFDAGRSDLPSTKRGWRVAVAAGLGCAAVVLGGRMLGVLEALELRAYDYFLRSRPTEPIDERLLIITNTDADISARPNTTNNRSLSDETLSDLLTRLDVLNPQLIGLDVYLRGEIQQSALAQQISATDNLFAICKVADHTTDTPAIPPPPEIRDPSRIGASDFVSDEGDDVVRRHLLAMTPPADSACQAGGAVSLLMANRYLKEVHGIAESERVAIGEAALPVLWRASFGGYHDANVAGSQILLNYRILDEPSQTGCGGVLETPADCISVGRFLEMSVDELRSQVENKIVLIGTTANGYGDPWRT
ncbi:MAG: CHASE2 domain-containing protein, partial [Cyanobacteria bacterium P01_C01_bin.121]